MEIKQYLIFKQITGKPASEEEFELRLKKFSRSAVIRLSSVLNMLLAKWSGEYDMEAHSRIVRSLFPPALASRIIATGQIAIHRHQLLFVMQEAIRHCDDQARDVTGPYHGGFGVVLLLASELLYQPLPEGNTPSRKIARRICQVLPDMEANGFQSYQLKMARSLAITSRFIEPLRGDKDFFDVPRLFEDANGISIDTYYALLFGAVSRFFTLGRLKDSKNPSDFAVPGDWFRETIVPIMQVENFFKCVSADSQYYVNRVSKVRPNKSDFTVLRDKPLFSSLQNYYPIDVAALTDKFESGVFWSINGHLDAKARENFHAFWGRVFEDYIQWLLSEATDGKINKVLLDPRYEHRPDDQVCDAIVVSGRCAILIECKGSTFTSNAKYGADPEVLDEELKTKVVGSAEKRKGVYQLFDAVSNLCRRTNADSVKDLDMWDITTIYPLILLRDDIGSALYLNAYLNTAFQDLIKGQKFSRAVTPLFTMSADDLEKLTAYLKDTSFSEILTARYKIDKELIGSLWVSPNSVLQSKGERKPEIMINETKKLSEITEKVLGLKDT